ncbi:hypothetical protein B0T16DRAFT_458877 [Cercophora newfieldiana]|uniref:Uncharacterized protein n=1 Tax=Cercophora newfieldiana TaxID=92897 RepID=A0AA39Y9K1_9PEZI|nr:hypothetical protein B0T16DRAFT_458877 [Cercophora newfieldiana]
MSFQPQQQPPAFRNETIVSAAHGNAAVFDATMPLSITHHAEGAVLKPLEQSPSATATTTTSWEKAKVHFPLPTLPSPRQEPPPEQEQSGRGAIMASLSLEIAVAPHGLNGLGRHHGPTRVTGVCLYAGQELMGSWGECEGGGGGQQQLSPLPADSDFRIHVLSDFYQADDKETLKLNNCMRGLSVTLTVEFGGLNPAICVSSVALVQTLRVVDMGGGFGMGGC